MCKVSFIDRNQVQEDNSNKLKAGRHGFHQKTEGCSRDAE